MGIDLDWLDIRVALAGIVSAVAVAEHSFHVFGIIFVQLDTSGLAFLEMKIQSPPIL